MAGLTFDKLFEEPPKDDEGHPITATTTEVLIKKGDLIVKIHYANNNSYTLYTVPAGRELLITSVWLKDNAATAAITGRFKIEIGGVLTEVLSMITQVGGDAFMDLTFPIPIKVVAGDTIQLQSTGASSIYGGFVGYIGDA